jgi:hypothetical protein
VRGGVRAAHAAHAAHDRQHRWRARWPCAARPRYAILWR